MQNRYVAMIRMTGLFILYMLLHGGRMDIAERSVLATLAYYGALRWPLTVVELSEHLIPSGRFGSAEQVLDISSTVVVVARLVASGRVRSDAGLLVIGDSPVDMARHRIERDARTAEKWRLMLRCAWWLHAVPYVRMMSASGSLAMGSSGPQSDWDLFVIVQSGRLYTARLGLLLVAGMLGRLRTKRMRVAPDCFCFNHIITTDGLSIRHRSLFTAQAISWFVPFYDPWGYASRLRQANEWVGDFVMKPGTDLFVRRTILHSRFLGALRRSVEFMLNTFIGGMFEAIVRRWMQKRIFADPASHARGGRIVADEREIEFHPDSFEAVALQRYNAALVRLGMGQYAEHDSGLMR